MYQNVYCKRPEIYSKVAAHFSKTRTILKSSYSFLKGKKYHRGDYVTISVFSHMSNNLNFLLETLFFEMNKLKQINLQ